MAKTRFEPKKIDAALNKHESPDDHHHQPTESREVIGYNEYLVTEILRRLPAVYILRFKSVSKHWYSVLSHLYNKLCASPHVQGLFYGDIYVPFDVNNRPPFRSLDFYPDPRGIKIVQSCNGLLLCCSKTESYDTRKYYVFNPTNKQFELIPSVKESLLVCFMGLAVDPADQFRYYKLVCVYQKYYRSRLHVQIYSSDTETWKISDETLDTSNYMPFLTCGVNMNGGMYWSPTSNPNDSWYYFKLQVEKFQKLELPSSMKMGESRDESQVCYFGESRGRLHLVEMVRKVVRSYLNVYEMMSDDSGWVFKYQVGFDQFRGEFYKGFWYHDYSPDKLEVLDIIRGEQDEDTFMVVKFGNVVKSYYFFDKSFKKLFVDIYGRRMESHRYVATSDNLLSYLVLLFMSLDITNSALISTYSSLLRLRQPFKKNYGYATSVSDWDLKAMSAT
ncbi:F-box protein At5g07610-like [Rutidosis leptorrhynchoides]|uniref:F-box protein At5g07610-like n=1 Tax=Rutidosis leptorrhynchoides TaxID=125765 RepID=UPI003A9A0CFC